MLVFNLELTGMPITQGSKWKLQGACSSGHCLKGADASDPLDADNRMSMGRVKYSAIRL